MDMKKVKNVKDDDNRTSDKSLTRHEVKLLLDI